MNSLYCVELIKIVGKRARALSDVVFNVTNSIVVLSLTGREDLRVNSCAVGGEFAVRGCRAEEWDV